MANLHAYFAEIQNKVKVAYSIAEAAREKGLDPLNVVEIPLASSLAERVVGIISSKYPQVNDKRIVDRIIELEKKYGKLHFAIPLIIAEEVAKQKFCKFQSLHDAIDAGIRLGIAYITLGVVASPLEGYTKFELKKTRDGKDYIAAYFSGPIRSAGGTAAAFSVIIIDYLRKVFGYAKYDATPEEIKRSVVEIHDYHERVTNLQYFPSKEEIETIAAGLPIQVTGEPSETKEVSAYKNLPRIETNRLRNGFCLVMAEGIALKAAKLAKILDKLKAVGIDLWDDFAFLKKLIEMKKQAAKEEGSKTTQSTGLIQLDKPAMASHNKTYLKDLAAGRPILGHPSASGALRLRYGRARNTGYSAQAIHPATMILTNGFIGIGTQFKVERPGKSTVVASCTSIDGPIVKLNDGSVIHVNDVETAMTIADKVEEIIYLGDVLINYGDFFDRNHVLMPAGYVEEFWFAQLYDAVKQIESTSNDALFVKHSLDLISELKSHYNLKNVSIDKAVTISKAYNIPLHPAYIFFWSQVNLQQLKALALWLKQATITKDNKLLLPYSQHDVCEQHIREAKRCLELLAVQHQIAVDNVVITPPISIAFLLNLGFSIEDFPKFGFDFAVTEQNKQLTSKLHETADKLLAYVDAFSTFDENYKQKVIQQIKAKFENETIANYVLQFLPLIIVNLMSSFMIMDKAGTFIGARMGRPEKAKERKMKGQPNVLFPVGEQGGRMRSVNAALQVGYIKADFPLYYCETCGKETIYRRCETCGKETKQLYYCSKCQKKLSKDYCELHGKVQCYATKKIDIRHYWEKAALHLKLETPQLPSLVKGVKGTSSADHIPENLAKGILRAMFNLHVNKDGTIRYDATEMPITHFRPREINCSIEKLKELGYTHDIYGRPLTSPDQLVEIMPQDIILPSCPDSLDEKADEFFFNVANFLDNLLVRFYGLRPFFELKSPQDLIGHLAVCMAPHTSAGVVTRIIGFSKTQSLLASPYVHAAMRRDCDGDEASIMLLLDTLINFSRLYLPSHRGSKQDAPLVLSAKILPGEVDDMIFNMDVVSRYPLKFYLATLAYKNPSEIKIEQIRDRLDNIEKAFTNLWFTHDTEDINLGVRCSLYKKLDNMRELVNRQMELATKLRAVDASDVARLVIEKHFIKDIKGNLRKFTQQEFRCSKCNTKYRRPPLAGKCLNCGGRIIFTISEGSIVKYLQPALEIAKKYNVPPYIMQSLDILKENIESIFGKEKEKQADLKQWFN